LLACPCVRLVRCSLFALCWGHDGHGGKLIGDGAVQAPRFVLLLLTVNTPACSNGFSRFITSEDVMWLCGTETPTFYFFLIA
jgi:hypothetical protein